MLVQTAQDVEAFLRWLSCRRFALACDTETTGFGWDARLRLVQFGDTQQGWALAWDQHATLIKWVVETYQGTVLFHNMKYDLHRLERHGVNIDSWLARAYDTDLVARVLWPAEMSFQLKTLAAKYLGDESKDPKKALTAFMKGRNLTEIQNELKASDEWGEWVTRKGLAVRAVRRGMGDALKERARAIQSMEQFDWETVPLHTPEYVNYAISDVLLTSRLYGVQYGLIDASPLLSDIVEFEHRILRLLYRMESRGLLIDPTYSGRLYRKWANRREELEAKFLELGVDNPNSDDQVRELLLAHGWKPEKFTKTGKPSLDAEVKEELAHQFPVARWVSEYGRLVKWSSSYVEHFINERDTNDRLHCSMRAIGARTHRMSISEPPLQQIPSSEATVRNCFVVPEDSAFVSVDYSAIEMRIAASLAHEENLIEVFESGVNPHLHTAKLIYHQEVDKKSERYKLSKIGNYAIIYGAGVKAIYTQTGCSKKVAQEFKSGFAKAYPALDDYMDRMQYIARSKGGVTLDDGRFLPVDPGFEFRATNYKVQGNAGLVLKRALLRLDEAGLGDYMVLPVHDEVLFETPKAEADDVRRKAEEVMQDFTYTVPLTTEGEVCWHRWGDKYAEKEAA